MMFRKILPFAVFLILVVCPSAFASVVDTDGDFMPDSWEAQYGLNPYDSSDAILDADNDHYTNFEEYSAGTDPSYNPSNPGTRSSSELIARGRTLLQNQELVPATTAFKFAVDVSPDNQEANFFYAVTRLLNLVESNQDGPDPDTMDSVKELLDRLGVTAEGRTIYNWTADFQRDVNGNIILPDTTPTGSELQEFLSNIILPEVEGALNNLSVIGQDFQITVSPIIFGPNYIPFAGLDVIEIDYTDVAFLRSILHLLKGTIYLATAYDADNINIADLYDRYKSNLLNITQVFTQYPNLLKIKDATNLGAAKTSLSSAIQSYYEAFDSLKSESDDQTDDFITIDPVDMADGEDFRMTLEDIESSLSQPTVIRPDRPDFRDPTGDYFTLDLSQFFDTPEDMRDYLPEFVANKPCSISDPTLGGILPDFTQEDWADLFSDYNSITVFSAHWESGYYAEIFVEDPGKLATSVTATGPGINGTMDLVYYQDEQRWWHSYNPFIGASIPSSPQIYTISITDQYNTCSFEKAITGYVEEFATYLYPVGETGGSIEFLWKGIPDASEYRIELYDSNYNLIWASDNLWPYWTSVYYYGPPLNTGETYHYYVRSGRKTAGVTNYSFAEGSFTYTGYNEPLPGSISGVVLAEDTNDPLPNLWIYAHTYQFPFNNYIGSAMTDASGQFTIDGLPPGYYRVEVSGSGIYAGEYYDNVYDQDSATGILVLPGTDTGNINFTLSEGGYISGTVVSESTGEPLQNIYIYAYGYYDYHYGGSARTDQDGHYIISGMRPGEYRVDAHDINGTYILEYYDNVYSWDAATPVHVNGGEETTGIDFTLSEGYPCHRYDKDCDWVIGDFELLDAIDEWAAGNLGDFELLDLIDLWAEGSYCWDKWNNTYKPGAHNESGVCQ